MIASDLLSRLWCPTCQSSPLAPASASGDADAQDDNLRCSACDASYPIRFGFPVLFPRDTLDKPEWSLWGDHLDKFQARRDARLENPNRVINRVAEKSQPQPPFAKFVDITEGTVLDVGCGPGNFRFLLDPSKVRYIGLDPIALPEACEFPFVQGLAEHMPFRDRTFTDIVVMAALDHFLDLDRFLREARRVLQDGGRLHILQSVHEARDPVSAIKVIAHKVKDALEDGVSPKHGSDVPKHLMEFTSRALVERMGSAFEVVSSERYSAAWYSPEKLFLSFSPKDAERHAARVS